MRRAILACLIPACVPDVIVEGTSSPLVESTAEAEVSGSDPTTGVAGPTTDPTTAGGSSSSDPTTGAVGTDTTSPGGSSSSTGLGPSEDTTGEAGEATETGEAEIKYSVYCLFGSPCKYFGIRKQDYGNNRCTALVVSFGGLPTYAEAPPRWGAEQAMIVATTKCWPEADNEPPDMGQVEQTTAMSGSGVVSFDFDGTCPTAVGVDVTLTFEPAFPWVPLEETLAAADMVVLGCG